MPTTYTHYRFGKLAKRTLPASEHELVIKYRGLFDIGLHGPDIFFYYKAYKYNPVNRYGYDLHKVSMAKILEDMAPIYRLSKNKSALCAYILGFIAHFTLDSYCHGYVERKTEESPVSHTRIETQLDRHLLLKDGLDPIKTPVAFSIHPSRKKAAVIAELFPVFDEEILYKTIFDMRFFLDLLSFKRKSGRKLLEAALTISGNKKLIDQLMDYEEYDYCKDSNLRLEKLFDVALKKYKRLSGAALAYLNEDKPLPSYFNNHFGPKPDYKDIPVLSYDEELNYVCK